MWQPSGAWNQTFRKALEGAFDDPSFALLITDYFAPQTFAKLSPPGPEKTHEFRLQEVINQAKMEGWLIDLVAAARERRPKNPALRYIAEDLGLTSSGPRISNKTGKSLEALVQENAKFINPALFRERLPQVEGQICSVEVPGNSGTGFLVGSDLVLTNYHVVLPIVEKAVGLHDVVCRFDYRLAVDGTTLDHKKHTVVRLASENWLVRSAPPSERDWEPELGDAEPEECDYALLRLAERIGDDPVGGPTADANAPKRSWIDATTPVPALAAGNQVFVLQHAAGAAQQLTVGTVKAFNGNGTRVRYDANSKKGSSGSPCFNADLQLVALHHAHDPAEPPRWNQAIPFGLIQDRVRGELSPAGAGG